MHPSLLAAVCLIASASAALAEDPPAETPTPPAAAGELRYTIATDQKVYRPGEPIVVTCTLTNRSDAAVTAPEPNDRAFSTLFTAYRALAGEERAANLAAGGDGRRKIGPSAFGAGGAPLWRAESVTLPPGQSVVRTVGHVAFSGDAFDWLPGRYELESFYHFADPEEPNGIWEASALYPEKYPDWIVRAEPASFTLRPLTPEEELERRAYEDAEAALLRPSILDRPPLARGGDAAPLEQFLEDRPTSIYRLRGLRILGEHWASEKDDRKLVEVYAQRRREKIGDHHRATLLRIEIDMRLRLGDARGAIRELGESEVPFAAERREELLEERPDLAPTVESRAADSSVDGPPAP